MMNKNNFENSNEIVLYNIYYSFIVYMILNKFSFLCKFRFIMIKIYND